MILMITAEHIFCLQVSEVLSILGIARFLYYVGDSRKREMGEWRYLPLTEAILTLQAVESVKEQMWDWNRANALHCTTSCGVVSPDWSLFCFRALIHWLIDAFKPSRSLWALFLLPLWLIFRDVRFLKWIVEFSGSEKGTELDTVSVSNRLPIKCLLISLSVVSIYQFCAWSIQIMNIFSNRQCMCIFNSDVLMGHIEFD